MTGNALYEDEFFKIEIDPKEENGHILYIEERGYFLGRGILEELSTTPMKNLEEKLNSVNDLIMFDVRSLGFFPVNIGYALNQARIRELEEERQFLFQEYYHTK